MPNKDKYIQIDSPAKINLFLRVIGKRPDNYHNIISLMCRVSLYDTVLLKMKTKATTIKSNHKDVPNDENNLAYKAAVLFYKALNLEEHIEIFIDKKIPIGAGLGGGSSNAASVLLGLNKYYEYPFSRKRLMEIGLEIGAG